MKNELIISMIIAIIFTGGVFLFSPSLTNIRTPTVAIPSSATPTPSSPFSTVPASPSQSSTVPPITTSTTAPTAASTKTLTRDDVKKHNTPSDCWIIINSKAYGVSPYLSDHPDGREAIIPYCGNDATQAFDTIKDGSGHPIKANQYLNTYYVANVQ